MEVNDPKIEKPDDGKMTVLEMVESAAKLQGGAMGAIIIAAQCVRKGGTVVLVGVYGARYNRYEIFDAKLDDCIKVVLHP